MDHLMLSAPLKVSESTPLSSVPPRSNEPIVPLPPLPEPDYVSRGTGALMGSSVVVAGIAIVILIQYGLCFQFDSSMPLALSWALMGITIAEGSLAFIFTAAILLVDPGIIKRDAAGPPMPIEVRTALTVGTMMPEANVTDEHSGRSYCIRCMLWRDGRTVMDKPTSTCGEVCCPYPGDRVAHHCSICQRCVRDFSHHCPFFGRCIGGRGKEGNALYMTLLKLDITAAAYTVACTLLIFGCYAVADNHPSYLAVTIALAILVLLLATGIACCLYSLCARLCSFFILRRCPQFSCESDPPKLPPEPVVVATVVLCGPSCTYQLKC